MSKKQQLIDFVLGNDFIVKPSLRNQFELMRLVAMGHNVLGLYAGWDFSTKAHKKYQCSTLHKCQLKVHQPTLRKTPVVGSAFLVI